MAEKEIKKAPEPFRFYTRLNLSELTGLKAANLDELLEHLREVPESAIYHHTHRFLQQHQYLSPEPPNDFAYWVSNILGEKELGEGLASIDTIEFNDINSLRHALVSAIEEYLKEKVDVLYQDVAQKNQAEIFLANVPYVKKGGYCVLALKSRSIDVSVKPVDIYHETVAQLKAGGLEIIETKEIGPFEKDHLFIVCRKNY